MRFIRTAAAIMAATALTASCSGTEQAAREPAASTTTTPAADTPSPQPDRDGDGKPDSLDDYPDSPLTGVEQEALAVAGSANIAHLHAMCSWGPDNAYLGTGEYSPSAEESALIQGMLVLCPDNPLAAEWTATVERGQADAGREAADAELEEAGRLFHTGTFLVGDEIAPGTYYVEGEIEDCYWERQNSAGEAIDNNFTGSGRRVEVTIMSSDYAFHSEGCGQWRPVS